MTLEKGKTMKQQKELFVNTKKQYTKKRQRLIERWLMRYKAKRKTYNITQKSISEATGYSLDKIKNIENGRVKITNEIMDNIDLAVENLNPEFALELLFDYCRIRFSVFNHSLDTIQNTICSKF